MSYHATVTYCLPHEDTGMLETQWTTQIQLPDTLDRWDAVRGLVDWTSAQLQRIAPAPRA
jgi:hypothetical protein